MKKIIYSILLGCICIISTMSARAATAGYVYLQIQQHGEAWYLYPQNGQRYLMQTADDTSLILKKLSLGVKHNFITQTEIFSGRFLGLILMDVEFHGEAYYINPGDGKKLYLVNATTAFDILKNSAQGITDENLAQIPVGDINTVQTTKILLMVPYTSQAPLVRWNDSRQAEGCEEASALMAVIWARGDSITPAKAEHDIIGMSIHEQAAYGEYRDSSAVDTLNYLIKGYLKYPNAEFMNDISFNEIIAALKADKVIVAPINGLAVKNGYYRQPGPPHHMIVIIGYDPLKNIFITHDPAARANYEFNDPSLYAAMRDYPTGFRVPIAEVHKNVIIVSK